MQLVEALPILVALGLPDFAGSGLRWRGLEFALEHQLEGRVDLVSVEHEAGLEGHGRGRIGGKKEKEEV